MSTGYQIYDQRGLYFLTFTIVQWADLFTRAIYREIVADSFNYCTAHKGLRVYAYVFMSNHIHSILLAAEGNLSGIIRDLKSHTAKKMYGQIQTGPESRREWLTMVSKYASGGHNRNETFQLWHHDNHAEELFGEKFIQQKLNYLHQNPVRAGLVREPQDWVWSSAADYGYEKQIGPVQVSLLQLVHSL